MSVAPQHPYTVVRVPVTAGTTARIEHGNAIGLEIIAGDVLGTRAYWRAPGLEGFTGEFSLLADLAGTSAPWSGEQTWIAFPATLPSDSSDEIILRFAHVGPAPLWRNTREQAPHVPKILLAHGELALPGALGTTELIAFQGDAGIQGVALVRDYDLFDLRAEVDTSTGATSVGDGFMLEVERPGGDVILARFQGPPTLAPVGTTRRAIELLPLRLPAARWRLQYAHAAASLATISWLVTLSRS